MRTGFLLATVVALAPFTASAAGIISNGTIELGVDDLGQLNIPGPPSAGGVPSVGLRHVPTNFESTAPGCLCEGWGVADATTGETGYANNSVGTAGLTFVSFADDGVNATTVSTTPSMRITHTFTPAPETPNLYQVNVAIENTSAMEIGDLRYRRVMDWDIEPTPFDEYSTVGGTAAATAVLFASDDGFASGDPLSGPSSIDFVGDAVDSGPNDHGALFDFGFGTLAAGETKTFDIYYGATYTEAEAFLSLNAVEAEVYSFGQASTDPLGLSANGEVTFIFGFKGVGGVIVPPTPEIPVPASVVFMMTGVGALAAIRRRRRAA